MLSPERIAELIRGALPGAEVTVKDSTGDGNHFEAVVVAPQFDGQPMLAQHRAVYAPLQPWLATGELHALALKTYSPAQWQKKQG